MTILRTILAILQCKKMCLDTSERTVLTQL
jgi:hypothetical protein